MLLLLNISSELFMAKEVSGLMYHLVEVQTLHLTLSKLPPRRNTFPDLRGL